MPVSIRILNEEIYMSKTIGSVMIDNETCIFATVIHTRYRIAKTICKHIMPEEALAGACVSIRVEETLNDGVIISALQVVEARLFDCTLPKRAI